MIDWAVQQKLRFQRGVGHVAYLMAIVNIYTAMKVTLSAQFLPAWVYLLIPVFYVGGMWVLGRYDERVEWSKKETAASRAVNDPVLLQIARDVEELKNRKN
jgi:hypothetical protein